MERRYLLVTLLVLCWLQPSRPRRAFRCPSGCSCSSDSIICVGAAVIPRSGPGDITSLSIVNCSLTEVEEAMFSLMPSLQLLLLSCNSLSEVKQDAFSGLPHLEYLFIEGNTIGELSGRALRGLRGVTHLSLANNALRRLPRGLFSDLRSLMELDLRGNALRCDCESVWLMLWLRSSNASVSAASCSDPAHMRGVALRQVPEKLGSCVSSEFVQHQVINTPSVSADVITHRDDIYVALTTPTSDSCVIMEWDHVEAKLRAFDNITGVSVVSCGAVEISHQLFILVSQLSSSCLIYTYDPSENRFRPFQTLELVGVSEASEARVFRVQDDWFLLVLDGSETGNSSLFRWNQSAFCPHQPLPGRGHTHAELLLLDGRAGLVLLSRAHGPALYRWDAARQRFPPPEPIPGAEGGVSIKGAELEGVVYLAVARYIGDSLLLRWVGGVFREVQAFPSRGAAVLQPLAWGGQHFLVLGSDFSFSQVFHWDPHQQMFLKLQDLYVQWPRSFSTLSARQRRFLLATSSRGQTRVFEHVWVNHSL